MAVETAANVAGEVFSLARDASYKATEAALAVRSAALSLENYVQVCAQHSDARKFLYMHTESDIVL